MPIRTLIRTWKPAPPDSVCRAAESLQYRDFLTVALIVRRPDPFPDNWIYVHDPNVRAVSPPLFRAGWKWVAVAGNFFEPKPTARKRFQNLATIRQPSSTAEDVGRTDLWKRCGGPLLLGRFFVEQSDPADQRKVNPRLAAGAGASWGDEWFDARPLVLAEFEDFHQGGDSSTWYVMRM